MRGRQIACVGLLIVSASGGALVRAGQTQQGVGQLPSSLPLTSPIRERGSSVSPAFEGWYFEKDGSQRVLVGYFNRNTKQEFDIPVGPNNRIDGIERTRSGAADAFPARPTVGPVLDQAAEGLRLEEGGVDDRRQWLHQHHHPPHPGRLRRRAVRGRGEQEHAPVLKFKPDGRTFTGAPNTIAEKFTATVGTPLALTVWATDAGPKINIPEERGRGRGRGAAGRSPVPAEFQPPPPLALTWSVFRAAGEVKFDKAKPDIDKEAGGKATVNATFSAPGEYLLRVEANDSTGVGGGGFQCCWTNAHVAVTVRPAAGTGGHE